MTVISDIKNEDVKGFSVSGEGFYSKLHFTPDVMSVRRPQPGWTAYLPTKNLSKTETLSLVALISFIAITLVAIVFLVRIQSSSSDVQPVGPVAASSFSPPDMRGSLGQGPVNSGQTVTQNYGGSRGADDIPAGYRATTITVDAESSVEGWVTPGSRVDVFWSSKVNGRPMTVLIMQNVRVWSVERVRIPEELEGYSTSTQNEDDRNGNPDARPAASDRDSWTSFARKSHVSRASAPTAKVPATATLLVKDSDSLKLQLAQDTGSLALALRGDSDEKIETSVTAVTLNDLLRNKIPVSRTAFSIKSKSQTVRAMYGNRSVTAGRADLASSEEKTSGNY